MGESGSSLSRGERMRVSGELRTDVMAGDSKEVLGDLDRARAWDRVSIELEEPADVNGVSGGVRVVMMDSQPM